MYGRFIEIQSNLRSLALLIFEAFVRILLIVNISLNQTLLTFLLYVRQTWMAQLILAISLRDRGYLPLIRKEDTSTQTHDLAVYVKKGLPFARELSLENSADSYLCFRLVLLYSVSYFFFFFRSPSASLYTVSDCISSNIDEVLSINPSANVCFWRL